MADSWMRAALGYGLLMLAWAGSNPAFAAPDEPAQFIRAASLAAGDFGRQPDYPAPSSSPDEEWFRRLTREVSLPDGIDAPDQLPCFAFRPDVPARCATSGGGDDSSSLQVMIAALDVDGPSTYQGTYPPFALAPAGVGAAVAAEVGAGTDVALRVARLANAVVCWLLIAAGLRLLGDVTGAALALTPMVLFLGGSVATSGIEIAAAFAVVAALSHLAGPGPTARGAWATFTVAGALLALARPSGPGFAVLAMGAALVIRRGRVARVPIAIVAAAAAGTLAWNAIVMPAAPARSLPPVGDQLDGVWRSLPRLGRELVGTFGWLDTPLPLVAVLAWAAAVALVVAAADGRGRAGSAALGAGVVVLAFALALAVANPSGAGLQGRWLLPLALAIPLVATTRTRVPPLPIVAVAAPMHLVALAVNRDRYDLSLATPWALVAVAGAAALVSSAGPRPGPAAPR